MKSINEVIQTIDPAQPQPQRRNYEHVSNPILDRFWLRMTEMYGGMWTNAQGDEPNETWWLGLRDLKPEQIKRGMVVVEPDRGRVVGSWGLSLAPTDHRLRIRKRRLYTWCALDAVGIPAGLGENASIASHCYRCGAPVNVEMAAGQVIHAEPANTQVWVVASQAGRPAVDFT